MKQISVESLVLFQTVALVFFHLNLHVYKVFPKTMHGFQKSTYVLLTKAEKMQVQILHFTIVVILAVGRFLFICRYM